MIIKNENGERMTQTHVDVDVILHPVRLRILLALAGRSLTAQDLAQALPEVPQATLYRHIHHLVDAALLSIEETRPVRGGIVENVYTLKQEDVRLTAEDVASLSPKDHLRFFTIFFTSVLRDFECYLQQEQVDVARDVRYHQVPLYLSDDELQDLMQQLTTIIGGYQNSPPDPSRRRRLLTSVIMPAREVTPRS
jgi:DNA-binding transcriptional ArsR family regulator